MNKTSYIVLSIVTLGIYPTIIHSKAKKQTTVNTEIKTSTTSNIDIKSFVKAIGGEENIVSVDSTISSLIVNLGNTVDISKEEQNKFGIRGLLINDRKYTFIFGDNANAIKNEINALLRRN